MCPAHPSAVIHPYGLRLREPVAVCGAILGVPAGHVHAEGVIVVGRMHHRGVHIYAIGRGGVGMRCGRPRGSPARRPEWSVTSYCRCPFMCLNWNAVVWVLPYRSREVSFITSWYSALYHGLRSHSRMVSAVWCTISQIAPTCPGQ
jgi:hypothetical protein